MEELNLDIDISDFFHLTHSQPCGEKIDQQDFIFKTQKVLLRGIQGDELVRIYKNGGNNKISKNLSFKLFQSSINGVHKFCYNKEDFQYIFEKM
jgi:hypothetical protein